MGSEYLESGLAGRHRHHGIPLQLIALLVLAGAMGGHISAPCLEAGEVAVHWEPTSSHGHQQKAPGEALRPGGRLLCCLLGYQHRDGGREDFGMDEKQGGGSQLEAPAVSSSRHSRRTDEGAEPGQRAGDG